jgi:hypothetical protein
MRRPWAAVVASVAVIIGSSAAVEAASVRPPELTYRCRLIASDLGEEIGMNLRLRTDGARDGWRIKLFHEGERVFSKIRRTNARGDLKVVRVEPNLPGRDELSARARHLRSGTVCAVESRI